MAFYGPNDRVATKAVVAIVDGEEREPTVLERWFSESGDVRDDPAINEQIVRLILSHDVKTVTTAERILGCPHEEGIDYPEASTCPLCPFWAHRDRWSGKMLH